MRRLRRSIISSAVVLSSVVVRVALQIALNDLVAGCSYYILLLSFVPDAIHEILNWLNVNFGRPVCAGACMRVGVSV